MKHYSFHIVLISFLVGVALATVLPLLTVAVWWSALITLGLLVLSWRVRNADDAWLPLLVAVCMVAMAVGLWRTGEVRTDLADSELASQVGTKVTLEGVIDSEPDVRERSTHLYVKTGSDRILVTTDQFSTIEYGDRVSISGTLSLPESFTTDVGREFDYPHYLLARDIVYTISFAHVEKINSGEGSKIVTSLLKIKQRLVLGIELAINEPAAGLGKGLLLGVKQGLGKELSEIFRTAGIVHIVVLSGYNIMLVISFALFCLRGVPRQARLMTAFIGVVLFALLVGLSATVVRASIMAGLFLFASYFYRTYDLTRSLLFAGAVMVFVSPFLLLYDIGFQLSFMATLGLILVAPKVELLFGGSIGLREYLIATIATQIAVLPLLLYYMGEVSLVAVPVNLLVLPMVPIAMLATFFAGVMALLSPSIALPVGFIAQLSLSYIIKIATLAAALPFASIQLPYFPISFLVALYALIIGALLLKWRRPIRTAVDGWTIVDEETIKAGARETLAPATTEAPIFFR